MFDKVIGSRAEVWHGVAQKTSGGMTRKDMRMNPRGEIVSVHVKPNPAFKAFIKAAKDGAKKVKSGFKKVPKKGTAAYKKLVK